MAGGGGGGGDSQEPSEEGSFLDSDESCTWARQPNLPPPCSPPGQKANSCQ